VTERRGQVAATRSPQEVFNHHAQALGAEDLDEIVADYSDDAIFITRPACSAARTAPAR
jgi:ketosteroid isomerase-like protein